MKLRTTPYGYAIENGMTVRHPTESQIVRHVFKEYLGGASFLKIAQTLTTKKAEFLPGRFDWNKNRVKRIIEDERYLGNDTYPNIIHEDMHRQARTVKDSNNNQIKNQSENPFRLPCSVECSCGAKMNRRHDSRRKLSQELWKCQNPECRRVVNITDETLLTEITGILNQLIADPNLIQANLAEPDTPIEVRRLQNEVDRQLDGFDLEKVEVKATIFSLAVEKYLHTDDKKIITQMLRAEFENQTSFSHFLPDFFKRTVKKIRFDDDKPALVLKNDQNINIGKEHDYADSNNTGNNVTTGNSAS